MTKFLAVAGIHHGQKGRWWSPRYGLRFPSTGTIASTLDALLRPQVSTRLPFLFIFIVFNLYSTPVIDQPLYLLHNTHRTHLVCIPL
jgi:hypothetical protein